MDQDIKVLVLSKEFDTSDNDICSAPNVDTSLRMDIFSKYRYFVEP